MGRASSKDIDQKFESVTEPNAKLNWLAIGKGEQFGGELLVAFELYLVRFTNYVAIYMIKLRILTFYLLQGFWSVFTRGQLNLKRNSDGIADDQHYVV